MAIDPNIKKKADDIRNKVYGREVRESLASGLEEMSSDVVENEVRQSIVESRQDSVESQWQAVSDEMTDKDVISAPEIIAARDGEANLKARLDKENQEVTAQLAQTMQQSFLDKDRATFYYKLTELNKTSGTVVMIGDSLTARNWYAQYEMIFPNITFLNHGVGGNTTFDVIDRAPTIAKGDLYVLAVGVNDVRYDNSVSAKTEIQYKENITQIIELIDNDYEKWVCIAPWPAFDKDTTSKLPYHERDKRTDDFGNALSELCYEVGALYINPTKTIRDFIDWGNKSVVLDDSIHPTQPFGMKFYADVVLYGNVDGSAYGLRKTESVGDFLYRIEVLSTSIINLNSGGANNVLLKKLYADQDILEIWTDNYRSGLSDPNKLLEPFTTATTQRFSNNVDEFPFNITFSTAEPIKELWQLQEMGANFRKAIGKYKIYKSTNKEAIVDLNHESWDLVHENMDTNISYNNLLYAEPSVNMSGLHHYTVRIRSSSDTELHVEKIDVSRLIIGAVSGDGTTKEDWTHLIVGNEVTYVVTKQNEISIAFSTNKKVSKISITSLAKGSEYRLDVYNSEVLDDFNVGITDPRWEKIYDEYDIADGGIKSVDIPNH